MLNVNQLMRGLKRLGLRLDYTTASTVKIYPPDTKQPFYSFHVGERGLHPLRRFAKQNWNLDFSNL
jgi:hypothetical protein